VAACKWVRRVWRGSSEDSADIDPLMTRMQRENNHQQQRRQLCNGTISKIMLHFVWGCYSCATISKFKNNVAFCLRMLHFSRSHSIMRLTKICVVFFHEAVNFQESMWYQNYV
jgi:hypothetical protein